MNTTYRLGIDIGSTTVKIACLDDNNRVVFSDYERHFANIRETLLDLIVKAKKELGNVASDKVRAITKEHLKDIAGGKRDFRF